MECGGFFNFLEPRGFNWEGVRFRSWGQNLGYLVGWV